jgi:hypothetical protein
MDGIMNIGVRTNAQMEKEATDFLANIGEVADQPDVLHIWEPNEEEGKILRAIDVDKEGNIVPKEGVK